MLAYIVHEAMPDGAKDLRRRRIHQQGRAQLCARRHRAPRRRRVDGYGIRRSSGDPTRESTTRKGRYRCAVRARGDASG